MDLSIPDPCSNVTVKPHVIATLLRRKHSNIGNFTQLSLTISHCSLKNCHSGALVSCEPVLRGRTLGVHHLGSLIL